jgi:hypothetical protein
LLSSKLENKITTQMLGVRSYIGVNIWKMPNLLKKRFNRKK